MENQAKRHVHGNIEITIIRLQADGSEMDVVTSPPKVPKPSSSGLRKGPPPRPYLAVKPAMQRRQAALIAKSNDKDALYHAAYSTTSKDTRYVMRRMKEDPSLASKIKEWHLKYLKKKGNGQ